DAAMVHSSTESHPAIVETLLEAGIPVFVDKPISYQLPESEALAELAERKNLPLFVGFNRRYAPLISGIDEPRPVHVQLQKNRPNQPNDARTFVLDDFIHVIDTLRFLSNTQRLPDIDIQVHWRNSDLAAVQVQWRNGDTLVTGAMNRICGVAEEQLQLFGQLRKWTVNNLRHGWLNENGKKPLALGFNDWEPTLVKRGFHAMFQAFLERVEQGGCNTEELKDALQTHRLCEKILTGIS
ncbi:MAG: Gfo/Idh/MocA family oxidoreductase, partial [Porticoccaceae bacterium]|nr:Gfo/Idh/MocA family oxidoreductase [Porticoccaceae bacterium]